MILGDHDGKKIGHIDHAVILYNDYVIIIIERRFLPTMSRSWAAHSARSPYIAIIFRDEYKWLVIQRRTAAIFCRNMKK